MTTKIKPQVLKKMGNRANKRLRTRIAMVLGVTDGSVRRWIDENSDNLTKAASLDIIRDELKLTDEQILDHPKNQGK